MRIVTLSCFALSLAACAAPEPLPRAELAPPLELEEPPVRDEERARADADQSPSDGESPDPDRGRPLAMLEQVGDYVPSDQEQDYREPAYRTVVETVEVPAPRPVVVVDGRRGRFEPSYDDYLRYRRSGRRWRPSRFPINTAIGAGVGAIIGHQRGRRDRGALIGGGIGLLLDLDRWSR